MVYTIKYLKSIYREKNMKYDKNKFLKINEIKAVIWSKYFVCNTYILEYVCTTN